jgi:hypothetical protein
MLEFVCDKNGVTREEIEKYYHDGTRKLVSDIVDEEFSKTGRDGIMPAQVYATWKDKGVAQGVDTMALIKETLTNFFLDSTQSNYERVCGISARYWVTADSMSLSANDALTNTIRTLNGDPLINKLVTEITPGRVEALAKIPTDQRFNVFSVPYSIGGPAQ